MVSYGVHRRATSLRPCGLRGPSSRCFSVFLWSRDPRSTFFVVIQDLDEGEREEEGGASATTSMENRG